MKILFSVILAILFVTAVLGQDDSTTDVADTTLSSTVSPVQSTTTSVETTTTSPTQSTTSPAQTTTSPAQTTTTSDDTTTTSPAQTTTTPEATTTTPSQTTTISSTSTTTTAASTTKAPQPTAPSPGECIWNVTGINVTCIRVEIKALFTIPINGQTEYIALTQNAVTNGSTCYLSNDTQRLVLTEPNNYTLTMIFVREDNKVYVNETTFEYSLPQGNGFGSSDSKLFSAKAGNSYMCKSQVNLKLANITMEVYDLHIQAFGEEGNTNFGSAEECEADDKVSDAVPIAVGCALAALIIIVLIAYLVGRRQSRQRGYQSV